MPRAWVWIQVLAGWLPVWAIYTALIFIEHQPVSLKHASIVGLRAIVPAAALGVLVLRLARRVPWPAHFSATFMLLHVAGAAAYALSWLLLSSVLESVVHGAHTIAGGGFVVPFLVLGVWLYAMVAGISYAIESTGRALRAESLAARTQLATLRAQLHPHFLFNALHTVVQLIPLQPAAAADAAEQVAGLLRTAVEETRDLVPLSEEWTFVARYLDIERIRFGERLDVKLDSNDDLRDVLVPSFALQTLVENAVRHGAAPRVEPTRITVSVTATPDIVTMRVQDNGNGRTAAGNPSGTGLSRLRERLVALYGQSASLALQSDGSGFTANLVVPRSSASHDAEV